MSKQPISSWWVLAVLPAIHILLILLTIRLSTYTPGATYYRIIGVDPLPAALLMVYEGVIIPLCFLVVGTAWWFVVGMLGWLRRGDRVGAVTRAVINTLVGLLGVDITVPIFRTDLAAGMVSRAVGVQYACAGMLFLGAFVSALYAWRAGKKAIAR
jgi:hypothetical protein